MFISILFTAFNRASSLTQQSAGNMSPISVFAISRQCCILSGEAKTTNFRVFSLTTRSKLKPTIYHTRDEYANHYTTDAVSSVYDALLVFVNFLLKIFDLYF